MTWYVNEIFSPPIRFTKDITISIYPTRIPQNIMDEIRRINSIRLHKNIIPQRTRQLPRYSQRKCRQSYIIARDCPTKFSQTTVDDLGELKQPRQEGSKNVQKALKTPKKASQTAPKRPTRTPSRFKDAPKTSPDGRRREAKAIRVSKRTPRSPKSSPRVPQEAPKRHPPPSPFSSFSSSSSSFPTCSPKSF